LVAVPETARRRHGNVQHIWCEANVLPYCGDLHWLGINKEITAETRRIGEFNWRTIDPPEGFRCGTPKTARETQQGKPIALGAYANYGFSNCIPEEPPEVSVIKKPVHGEVVIIHQTHPVEKSECEGKPANVSIVIYEPSRTQTDTVEIEYEVVSVTYKETGIVKEPKRFVYLVKVK
jgi:hypothetical protein